MFDEKAYKKKYHLAHREKLNKRSKEWYLAHRDRIKEYKRKYYLAHWEEEKARGKKWRLAHPEVMKKLTRNWQLAHPEKVKGRNTKYQLAHPEKVRNNNRKQMARRRNFGFIPLNDYFIGAEGHHINYNYIIYIPKKLHRSIWHSLTLGQNMDKINKKAFEFLKKQRNIEESLF